MQSSVTEHPAEVLAPIKPNERIQALDVIRGFALLGIFLMNVEFFNRPMGAIGLGLPTNLTGADWWAGWLIYNFVQGKFWTLFSLLFGMGFAVMLTRAERAEREFLPPYLRRIGALALFGAAHYIFIWAGDILFSYSVGALGLLILLYGKARYIVLSILTLIACGATFEMDPLQGMAASLAILGVAALFLRNERRLQVGRWSLPVVAVVALSIGLALMLAALVFWSVPGLPKEPKIPLTIGAIALLAIGALSAKFHQPASVRMRRLGAFMYLFPFLMMALGTLAQTYLPHPEKTPEELIKREERIAEYKADMHEEVQVMSQGSYVEAVKLRAKAFAEHAPEEAGFAAILAGMFLLGAWFVRSGVMENTGAHLALFRKLALYGLPLGLSLGLLGSSIATSYTPGQDRGPFQLASSLAMIGNLPACLGYASVIVLMLHSGGLLSRIRVLAPAGRMALTNYLTQSLLGTWFFYGYGLGYWGTGRAKQVLFVAVVYSLQIAFSHWWLARFQYGPMEWLWRAITYWQLPPMRRRAV